MLSEIYCSISLLLIPIMVILLQIEGRYFGELVRQVIDDLEDSKYQKVGTSLPVLFHSRVLQAEYRISIYGRKPTEWSKAGKWFIASGVKSESVRWLIQVPRLLYVLHCLLTSFLLQIFFYSLLCL